MSKGWRLFAWWLYAIFKRPRTAVDIPYFFKVNTAPPNWRVEILVKGRPIWLWLWLWCRLIRAANQKMTPPSERCWLVLFLPLLLLPRMSWPKKFVFPSFCFQVRSSVCFLRQLLLLYVYVTLCIYFRSLLLTCFLNSLGLRPSFFLNMLLK